MTIRFSLVPFARGLLLSLLGVAVPAVVLLGAAAAQSTAVTPPVESPVVAALRAVQDGQEHHVSRQRQGGLWCTLAIWYQDAAQFEEARKADEEALRLLDHDPSTRAAFATTLDNLGLLYVELGALDQARSAFVRAYEIHKRVGGPVELAGSQESMAEVELASHRFKQAAALASQALVTLRLLPEMEAGAAANSTKFSAWITIAFAAGLGGKGSESLHAAEEALRLAQAQYSADMSKRAKADMALGLALWKTGASVEADRTFREGLRLYRETKGETSPHFLAALQEYHAFVRTMGSKAELAAVEERLERLSAQRTPTPCVHCTVSVNALR